MEEVATVPEPDFELEAVAEVAEAAVAALALATLADEEARAADPASLEYHYLR